MSNNYQHEQTMATRRMIVGLAESMKEKADMIPPGWSNNVRWHLGHLVTTPRLLTFGLLKEPLGIDENYRAWFAKGTSPADWPGGAPIPSVDSLIGEVVMSMDDVFLRMESRMDEPFPEAYTTSVGVVLKTPRESLNFSFMHDGIHLGLLLALRRSLSAA